MVSPYLSAGIKIMGEMTVLDIFGRSYAENTTDFQSNDHWWALSPCEPVDETHA